MWISKAKSFDREMQNIAAKLKLSNEEVHTLTLRILVSNKIWKQK